MCISCIYWNTYRIQCTRVVDSTYNSTYVYWNAVYGQQTESEITGTGRVISLIDFSAKWKDRARYPSSLMDRKCELEEKRSDFFVPMSTVPVNVTNQTNGPLVLCSIGTKTIVFNEKFYLLHLAPGTWNVKRKIEKLCNLSRNENIPKNLRLDENVVVKFFRWIIVIRFYNIAGTINLIIFALFFERDTRVL